jgi:hypothetical protein
VKKHRFSVGTGYGVFEAMKTNGGFVGAGIGKRHRFDLNEFARREKEAEKGESKKELFPKKADLTSRDGSGRFTSKASDKIAAITTRMGDEEFSAMRSMCQ